MFLYLAITVLSVMVDSNCLVQNTSHKPSNEIRVVSNHAVENLDVPQDERYFL